MIAREAGISRLYSDLSNAWLKIGVLLEEGEKKHWGTTSRLWHLLAEFRDKEAGELNLWIA